MNNQILQVGYVFVSVFVAASTLIGCTLPLGPPPPIQYDDTLLVVNKNSAESLAIRDYFLPRRNFPIGNVCLIETSTEERVSQEVFEQIRASVHGCLSSLDSRRVAINYMITTKGVPLAYTLTPTDLRSVDNALTLIRSTLIPTSEGAVSNSYLETRTKFSQSDPNVKGIYLVTRLTGYDVSDVKTLIDLATIAMNYAASTGLSPEGSIENGKALIDLPPENSFRSYEPRLTNVTALLSQANIPTIIGGPGEFITSQKSLAFYWSFGANDTYSPPSYAWDFQFLPGAIAETAVSFGGRTFNPEPVGGIARVPMQGGISLYPPQSKSEIVRTNINRIIQIGSTLYAGSGGYHFNYRMNRKKAGTGIFAFDAATLKWSADRYTQASTGGDLVGDYINDLKMDPGGHMVWVGTQAGLSSFDSTTKIFKALLTGVDVREIAPQGNEILWLATNTGLIKFNPISKAYITYSKLNGILPSNDIQSVVFDSRSQKVWLSAYSTGLGSFDGSRWIPHIKGQGTNAWIRLYLDGDYLWAASSSDKEGISQFNVVQGTWINSFDMNSGLGQTVALDFRRIPGGALLISTAEAGVKALDSQGGFSSYLGAPLLPSRAVNQTILDAQGEAWVALGSDRQSLVADLISMGVTGVKGYVDEPTLGAVARPETMVSRYHAGFNLAETYYASSSLLNWKDVVIGDPKVAPYISRTPPINFSFIETNFTRKEQDDIILIGTVQKTHFVPVSYPAHIGLRVSVATGRDATHPGGVGTWSLDSKDLNSTTWRTIKSGTISEPNIVLIVPSSSWFLTTQTTPEFDLRLSVRDKLGALVSEDTICIRDPSLSSQPIGSITNLSPLTPLFVSQGTVSLLGTSKIPAKISYAFQIRDNFGGAYETQYFTDGVSLLPNGIGATAPAPIATLNLSLLWAKRPLTTSTVMPTGFMRWKVEPMAPDPRFLSTQGYFFVLP